MSHELRTPLNAILGFSEMLARDRQTSAAQREHIAIINRSGEHLLGMINNVLDLSKIEAGQVQAEETAFDLPAMLRDLGNMMKLRAEGAGLHFKLALEAGLPQYVRADAGKLRQILIDLLGNAVNFTHQGGISLRARSDEVLHKPLQSQAVFDAMAQLLGVRYTYGEVAEAVSTAPKAPLSAQMLQGLPEALRASLSDAARQLDIEASEDLIGQLRDTDSAAADGLQALVHAYRFDRILELLDSER